MKFGAAFLGGAAGFLGASYIVVRFFADHFGIIAGDFRAFYCAATVARSGGNPYLAHAMAMCESVKAKPALLFSAPAGVVLPAPLPGYGIAFFLPFTSLPFATAALCWSLVLVVAVVASIAILRRLTGLPYLLVIAALVLSAALTSLWSGQLVPVVLLALVAAAWLVQRKDYPAAALAALLSMLEPHVGLPACIALFLWCRPCRIPLLVGGFALGAISVAVLGAGVSIEYFTKFLPAHAEANRTDVYQYSLTWALHQLGAPNAIGTLLGELSYAVALVLGVVLARPTAVAIRDPAAIVLLPPAFVLFGGTFIHIAQMCLAIPIVLLLLARASRRYRTVLAFALAVLAIPWLSLVGSPLTAVLAAIVAAICVRPGVRRDRIGMAAMAATALFLVGCSVWVARFPHPHAASPLVAAGTKVSASAVWAHYLTQTAGAAGSAFFWVIKVPTWIGLVALLATVFAIAVERFRGEAIFDSRSRADLRGKLSQGRAS